MAAGKSCGYVRHKRRIFNPRTSKLKYFRPTTPSVTRFTLCCFILDWRTISTAVSLRDKRHFLFLLQNNVVTLRVSLSSRENASRRTEIEALGAEGPSARDVCREVPSAPCESSASMRHNIRPYRAGGTRRWHKRERTDAQVDVGCDTAADSVGGARDGLCVWFTI